MSFLETGSVIEAIKALNPDAGCSVVDNDPDRITWDNEADVISKEDILAKVESFQYHSKRKDEYPELKEQLDQIYHDFDGWKESIKAIKDRYPKP
jgi:adenylosuccinate synthase